MGTVRAMSDPTPDRQPRSTRAAERREHQRRRRRTVIVGCVVAVLVAAAGGAFLVLRGGDDPSNAPASVRAAGATTTAEATTTTATTVPTAAPTTTLAAGALSAIDTSRRYPVGTSQATFVDSSRSTSPNGDFAGAATRTIPVEYFYPAEGQAAGSGDGDSVAGASPDRAHGPYPLILFSHGYAVTPEFYRPLLERWAAAGYVVAAPVYPILSGTPGGASHTDYEKTFDDAGFVITQVLALPASDPLSGMVDPERIAAAGHSDGEVIAFAQGLLACCRDDRVKAVLAMAGDLSNANNPNVRNAGVPILHIMETADEYDPYQHSIDWDRENLDPPRWMLSLPGSSHVPPYTQPGNAAFELVSAATIDFFDGTLKGHPEQLDAMAQLVAASNGVATLER
jgi:dienelactone hydrolase